MKNNTQDCDHRRVTEPAVDLELCVTKVVIKANQMVATDGSTAFERYSGLSVHPLIDLAALNNAIVCPPSWLSNVTPYQQTNPVHRLVPAVTCVRNRYLNVDGICRLKFFLAFTRHVSNFVVQCTAINFLRLWNEHTAEYPPLVALSGVVPLVQGTAPPVVRSVLLRLLWASTQRTVSLSMSIVNWFLNSGSAPALEEVPRPDPPTSTPRLMVSVLHQFRDWLFHDSMRYYLNNPASMGCAIG